MRHVRLYFSILYNNDKISTNQACDMSQSQICGGGGGNFVFQDEHHLVIRFSMYFPNLKIDPKYKFLHAFCSISCLLCVCVGGWGGGYVCIFFKICGHD